MSDLSHDNPNLVKKMDEAKKVLKEDYKYFYDLIVNYKVKTETPYWDLTCFLIYYRLRLSETLQNKWLSFWMKSTQKHRRFGNLVYTIPVSYYHFLIDEKSVESLYAFLVEKEQSKRELSWEEYLWLFFKKRDLVRPKFTNLEFEMFKDILEIQSLSNQDLKERAWKRVANISKYKKRVLDKGVIFQGLTLNTAKLGLATYHLLFHLPFENATDIFSLIPESQYLRYVQIGNIGTKTYLVNFQIPDNRKAIRDLEKLSGNIHKENPSCKTRLFKHDRQTKLVSYNFTSYNSKYGNWDFLPLLHKLYLEKFPLDEDRAEITIRPEFSDYSREKLKLSRNSLEFLNHLLQIGHISRKHMVKNTGLTETTVRKQLAYLEEEQLIKTRINPMVVFGLSSIVVLLSIPPQEQHALHQYLALFPEVYTERYIEDDKEGIIVILRCPQEDIYRAMEILRKIFEKKIIDFFIIDQFYSRRYQLPIDSYNSFFQHWEYNSKDLLDEI